MKNILKKPLFLIILLAYVVFTAFFEESFIFTHLYHRHDHNGVGESCSLCYEIERAQLLLESLGRIGIMFFAIGLIMCEKKQIKKRSLPDHALMTLIALKVQLNT
ncbi:MAG: hypothetical protein LBP19_00820 [Treponema sp.]|nr:hypothetical protein [Treponema sp.]